MILVSSSVGRAASVGILQRCGAPMKRSALDRSRRNLLMRCRRVLCWVRGEVAVIWGGVEPDMGGRQSLRQVTTDRSPPL
jgi:hypothetical protein